MVIAIKRKDEVYFPEGSAFYLVSPYNSSSNASVIRVNADRTIELKRIFQNPRDFYEIMNYIEGVLGETDNDSLIFVSSDLELAI